MRNWLSRDDAEAALAVVFLPMLGSDDRASAVVQAGTLADPRVTCFWDAARLTGAAWTAGHARPLLAKLLEGFDPEDPLAAYARQWLESGRPIWDVAYFFDGSGSWPEDGLPAPVAWTKQIQFGLDEDGRSAGNFWSSSSPGGPEWSAWSEEFRDGMDTILADAR